MKLKHYGKKTVNGLVDEKQYKMHAMYYEYSSLLILKTKYAQSYQWQLIKLTFTLANIDKLPERQKEKKNTNELFEMVGKGVL